MTPVVGEYLDKVLRLAGEVGGYERMEHGKPEHVGGYERWGTQGHHTGVSEAMRESQARQLHFMETPRPLLDTRAGPALLRYIWSLDDATLLGTMRNGSPEHAEVRRRLGNINPHWVTARAAAAAYERGLIGEAAAQRILSEWK